MSFYEIICFLIFVAVIDLSSTTSYSKCADKKSPLGFRITQPLTEEQPVKLIKNTDLILEMDLGIDNDTNTLTTKVMAYAAGIAKEYPLDRNNACDDLINGECPLDSGEEVTYRLIMPISEAFPTIGVVVEMYLVDDNNVAVACIKVAGEVVDA